MWKEEQKVSDKLEQTRSLLERLHQTQYDRLSAPLPPHLSQISPVVESEYNLGKNSLMSVVLILNYSFKVSFINFF